MPTRRRGKRPGRPRPTIIDLEAIVATLERIRSARTAPMAAVLNSCAAGGHDADDAEAALVAVGWIICPVRIRQRVALGRSLLVRIPVKKATQSGNKKPAGSGPIL